MTDVRLEGEMATATQIPASAYKDTVPELVDTWVVDDMDALPPYDQFVLGVIRSSVNQVIFRLGAVDVADRLVPVHGIAGIHVHNLVQWVFRATDDECRTLCRFVASGLANQQLHVSTSETAWHRTLEGYLKTLRLSQPAVGAMAAAAAAGHPAPWAAPISRQGPPQPAGGGADTQAEAYRRGWENGRADIIEERDDLREKLIEISDALELADPNNFPGPMSDAERITALGRRAREGRNGTKAAHAMCRQLNEIEDALLEADGLEALEGTPSLASRIRVLGNHARQITDMLVGAAGRTSQPAKPDTPLGILMTGTRGIGGAVGVLHDVAAERLRAEEKFPDQHLPDGTSLEWRTEADLARKECNAAVRRGNATWLQVVREEVIEAFGEVEPAKLRAELIQVGATVLRWVEDIDRRAAVATDITKE